MTDDKRRGVLFDVDGTLVDTTYLHTVSWWEALRQADHRVPMARIHRSIGMGSDKLLDHLLGAERNRDADGRLRDAHDALYGEYWERLTPLPGARELLRACAERGLRVVLATSAAEHEVTALRAALDADDVIDSVTSSADARESKPAPDILVAALEQSGLATRLILQIHDELLFEGPAEEAERARDVVVPQMVDALALDPPLVVDAGIGPNWLDAK